MANKISAKRIQIDKNNATMVIILATAAFITIFSIFACKALLSQRSYQNRVISEKKKTLAQLKTNNKAASDLVNAYKVFVNNPENILGGTIKGSGDKDGDNAKIILDALPSKYDFPGLATSLDKLFTSSNFTVNGISGTDDELKQNLPAGSAAPKAIPIEIPFQVNAQGTFDGIQSLTDFMDRSIRPIKVNKISLNGNDSKLTASIEALTYYQPEQKVQISTRAIK